MGQSTATSSRSPLHHGPPDGTTSLVAARILSSAEPLQQRAETQSPWSPRAPAPWRAVQAALAPAAPALPARPPWMEGEREHALRATSG